MPAMRVPSSTPRRDRPKGTATPNLQRAQLNRFQMWQRSTQQSTAALVRLVRMLAR